MDDPKAAWIQTFTGRAFYPLDPKPDDVDIIDIAHALSLQCRFTGHVRTFYSVAEHSVWVSNYVPRMDALWGLMHDASEAYLIDLCRPLKRYSDLGVRYREIESKVMGAICERFGLSLEEPANVGIADRRMLMTEKRDLLRPSPIAWTHTDEPYPGPVSCWSPEEAERIFLDRFADLVRLEAFAFSYESQGAEVHRRSVGLHPRPAGPAQASAQLADAQGGYGQGDFGRGEAMNDHKPAGCDCDLLEQPGSAPVCNEFRPTPNNPAFCLVCQHVEECHA